MHKEQHDPQPVKKLVKKLPKQEVKQEVKEEVKQEVKQEVKEEVKVLQSVINLRETNALGILIQAVKIAQNKGAFELDDAIYIGNAKNILQGLIK